MLKINLQLRPGLALLIGLITCITGWGQVNIKNIDTGTKASLRGLSAVTEKICWVSGSQGTVLKTLNGGTNWINISPKGYQELQFRDIHTFGKDTAIILSAGLPAVILKTTNGGQSWKECYRNETEGVFFDAMDFWDHKHGMAFSDAPNTKLFIIETLDGGISWHPVPDSVLPDVAARQGGFAASGTCLRTFGKGKVIIGLGGQEATILLSENYGKSWYKTKAPLDEGAPSKGVYSIDFLDDQRLIAVGGDYLGDSLTVNNMALSGNGGHTWQLVGYKTKADGKYRSCVIHIDKLEMILVTSRTGIDYSIDRAQTWKSLKGSYYSVSEGEDGSVWFSGPDGKVGLLEGI